MIPYRANSRANRRILLVEDDPLWADALSLSLRTSGLDQVTVVRSLAEAYATLDAGVEFDIALIDPGLPDGSGLELAWALAERVPHVARALVTARWDDAIVNEALRVPVDAFGRKPLGPEGPLALIEDAEIGRDHRLNTNGEPGAARTRGPSLPDELTQSERRVVRLQLAGYTYSEMAKTLEVSVETVRTHVKHARTKLGAQNRSDKLSELIRRRALGEKGD